MIEYKVNKKADLIQSGTLVIVLINFSKGEEIMHVDIVDTMFDFTQTIGSNEDILTGALATAFYYCPKFTKLLFEELKIDGFVKSRNPKILAL